MDFSNSWDNTSQEINIGDLLVIAPIIDADNPQTPAYDFTLMVRYRSSSNTHSLSDDTVDPILSLQQDDTNVGAPGSDKSMVTVLLLQMNHLNYLEATHQLTKKYTIRA